jgi:predicted AAA+ superfamily ATPase
MGVLTGCKPRKEVLKGDLDDAIFAADFGDLISGKAPKVYGDAKTFFQNTHPAKQLCKVIEVVFERLADPKEAGATVRLSTGFGGGKTHTLMALWHLAQNIENLGMGTELLPAAGRPKSVTVAALDLSRTAGFFPAWEY